VAIEVAEIVRDALLGKGIRNAANYPCLDAESCKILNPYINLGEKLGMFSAQLVEGRFMELVISYSGQITKYNLSPVTMALVKGILTPILKDTVNFVNGTSLLKERGIKLLESKSGQEGEFVNLIQLEIKTDKETKSILGTLSGNKQPRIVKIDDYYLDLYPVGEMIFIRNLDKPGLIGNLGTLMGKNGINIAAMALGRNKPGDKAISVWSVDNQVSPEIQEKIKKLENILTVKIIRT
jgi:D-3-phosphoglycerate dehydrogenase